MRRFAPLALVAALACSADSTTGLGLTPFTLEITAPASVQGASTVSNGSPAYTCAVPIQAKAVGGSSGELAEWTGATIAYRLNSNGQTSSQDILGLTDWFGSDRVQDGQTVNAHVALTWASPFSVLITVRYVVVTAQSPLGEARSANLSVACN